MKRIDDKIKEIEKKDKTNRLLFYGIIGLIIVFLIYVNLSEKAKKAKDVEISELQIKNSETYKTLEETYVELDKTYKDLKSSLRPEEYWNHIKDASSVEAYIEYITNDWGIDKPYLSEAIENIDNNVETELTGYLYIGKMVDGKFVDDKNRSIVVWRENSEGNVAKSKPQKNDILRLTYPQNITTYKNKNLSNKNGEGWRPGTKAFVSEVIESGIEIILKIKYY
ncbi:hypothetical protein MWU50_13250 [Flavobacteriaceae bacterium S0862]|nr:hypothetical protein [Flavobacteriaceae bacterium S0862]